MRIFKSLKIARLFNQKQYALLFAKYYADLSRTQLGRIICELGLYERFIVEPKWKDSSFHAVALLYMRDFSSFRKMLRSLIKRKQLTRNDKQLILKGLLLNYPSRAKGFCKLYFPNNKTLYYSLLSTINHASAKNYFLKKNISLELSTPHDILLTSNLLAKSSLEQKSYINLLMGRYNLRNIKLYNEGKPLFVTNLTSSKSLSKFTSAPLVSVLVTTFNSERFIKESLLSLVNQDYANREIIVIDDHSNDNTCEIVEHLASQYPFIKLIKLPDNVGTFVAKTIGAEFAKGEFITCHDSDDWAHPEKLTKQVEPLLKDPNLVVTFSKWFRVDEEGNIYSRMVYPFIRLNPASALFRKNLVKTKTGLWDWVKTGADSEFNARLKVAFGSKAVKVINQPLTIGAHREDSLMTSAKTGVESMGQVRRLYWESWNKWHIEQLSQNKVPYCHNRYYKEQFPIPSELMIDLNKIRHCFNQFNLNIAYYGNTQ